MIPAEIPEKEGEDEGGAMPVTVEIPVEDLSHIDPVHVKRELDKNGLVCGSVCACMGPDRDLRGTPTQQQTGLDYMLQLMAEILEGLTIDRERMRANLYRSGGVVFSQRVLLALVQTGMTRDDAYRIVQRLAQRALAERIPMRELLGAEEAGRSLDLDQIFDYEPFVRYADEIVGRLDQLAAVAS